MPSGARELSLLGAHLREAQPFLGIRYLQQGAVVEARFREGEGLGIRRTELSRALRERALEVGAELRRATVRGAHPGPHSVEVLTDGERVEARLLVAADGLQSRLRRAAGLDGPRDPRPQRYGIRRHFQLAPWTDLVEVYWTRGAEAYVTPVGPRLVNVAFLSERGSGFDELLALFPALQERLGGAEPASETRGAGPLLQRALARYGRRLALLGDAAGYVDAITGQGLSLAFAAAALLIDALPADLSGDLEPALRRYDEAVRGRWVRYAVPARVLVGLSRRPALREKAIRTVAALPGAFGVLVRVVG